MIMRFSLGLKNKRFVCPFGLKIRRVGRSIFFFFKIWMQKKCNTIHVRPFLGMQSLRIKINPGVERGLYSIISDLKNLFGTVIKKF